MRVWTAGALLIGVPLFITTLIEIATGSGQNAWIGIFVPVALIGFGFGFLLLPQRYGARQKFYLDFLKNTLQAHETPR
jgi:hypothetical protein